MLSRWPDVARAHFAYRLDRFLRMHGLVQVLLAVATTCLVLVLFASVLAMSGGAPDAQEPRDYLWWTLGRFSDGGTMYGDQGARVRVLAFIVTWTAVFAVQFMTGAITAKLMARLDQLRSGRSPVVERGHILVLGFDSRVPLMARELARSHQRQVLVVLADASVHEMEAATAPARRIPRHRLRMEMRVGDPRDEIHLLRVAADRARAVVVLSPEQLDDESARRWSFSVLLALRRVVGRKSAGHVIVETRHQGRDDFYYEAAADPCDPGAGGEPLRLILVAGDDIMARLLAQSVRQTGAYFVLRELMTFRGAELYFESLPTSLAGRTFAQAHARIVDGIAVGLQQAGAAPLLNPPDEQRLSPGDRLIILEDEMGSATLGRDEQLPDPPACGDHPDPTESPASVVVLGENRLLARFLIEMSDALPAGSLLHVISSGATRVVKEVSALCERARLTATDEDPRAVARNPPDEILRAASIVILGGADDRTDVGDSEALETLVCLRHAERQRGVRARRTITELRELSSATHVASAVDDFLVSAELLGLLMAQLVVTPELNAILHADLLQPGANDVRIRPRSLYAGHGPASFAQVMAAARQRQEIAIGLYISSRATGVPDLRALLEGRAETASSSPVWLAPPRDTDVPADASIIVLGRE